MILGWAWDTLAKRGDGVRHRIRSLWWSPLTWLVVWMGLSTANSVAFDYTLWQTTQVLLVILFALLLQKTTSITRFTPRFFMCFWLLAALQALLVIRQHGVQTPYGFFPNNANWGAGFMGAALVSVVAWVVDTTRRTRETGHGSRPRELLLFWCPCIALSGILGVALVLVQSRGALLGSLGATWYVLMVRWRGRAGLLCMAGILALLAGLPVHSLQQYLKLDSFSPFANQRLAIAGVALQGVRDHPFLGYGLGNFEYAYHRHAFPVIGALARYGMTTPFAHNEYLQVATEMGLPALGLLGIVLWNFFQRNPSPTQGIFPWGTPAKAGLLVLLVQGLFDFTFHLPVMLFLGAVLYVVGAYQIQQERLASEPTPAPPSVEWIWARVWRPIAYTGCLALMMLTAAYGTAEVLAASGLFTWATRVLPWKAAYWEARGQAEVRTFQERHGLGQLRLAESYMLMANHHDPQNPTLYEELAQLYLSMPPTTLSSRRALWAYDQAIAYAPRNALRYAHLGAFLLRRQEAKRAFDYFRAAVRLEPYCFEAHQGLAVCYIELQDWRRAKTTLDSLVRLKAQADQFLPMTRTGSAYERHLTQWHPHEFEAVRKIIAHYKKPVGSGPLGDVFRIRKTH